MIGDTETAALVGRDGSIDWLCLARFDSGSCFSKLLGNTDHGRWQITAQDPVTSTSRRYQGWSMVLQTEIVTDTGVVHVIDFMPPRHHHPRVVRIVRGIQGEVRMLTELIVRFEYGMDVPWVHRTERGLAAIAGPNAICVDSPIELEGSNMRHEGRFGVAAGEELVSRSAGILRTKSHHLNLTRSGHCVKRCAFGTTGVRVSGRCTASGRTWRCGH